MMKNLVTVGGFIASVVLLAMAAVLVGALNLILNGYHRECGIWRNVVPFACSPKEDPPARVYGVQPDAVQTRASIPTRVPPAPKKVQKPKPPNNPYTGRREPWGCGPLQPEPYRVQCIDGVCYHDPGFRANCGVAHDWSDGQ